MFHVKHFIIPNVGLFHVKHFGQFTSAEVFASAFIFSGFDRGLRKPLSGQRSGETTRGGTGKKECGPAEDAFLGGWAGRRKKDGGNRGAGQQKKSAGRRKTRFSAAGAEKTQDGKNPFRAAGGENRSRCGVRQTLGADNKNNFPSRRRRSFGGRALFGGERVRSPFCAALF